MPNKEIPQNITAREAVSRIVDDITRQRRVEGKEDGLRMLAPSLLGVLNAFEAGDVPIETTIFTASGSNNLAEPPATKPTEEAKSPPDVAIIDSIDKLPEEIRGELKFDSPLKRGEKEKTLLKILSITSENKPITKKLLFNVVYRKDVSKDLDGADRHTLNALIYSEKKKIKAKGLTIISKIMVITDKGKESKESVYWLTSIDNYRRTRSKIDEVLTLLRTASEKNPLSYKFLAQEIFGEATDKNIGAMRTALCRLRRRSVLGKSGEVIKNVPLNEESKTSYGQTHLGFYIVKKDNQVAEVPSVEIEMNSGVKLADRISDAPIANVPIVPKSPSAENELNSSFLNEREIYIIAKKLLAIEVNNKELLNTLRIDVRHLYKDEMVRLFNRVRGELSRKKINVVDYEPKKEDILPILGKLDTFGKDPKKYLKSCTAEAKILLSCFNSEKITFALLNQLFPVRMVPIQKSMVKRGV